jgi:hypothetical protein
MCGNCKAKAASPAVSGETASDNVHVCWHSSAHDAVFAIGALQPADYVLCAVWAVVIYHDDLKVLPAAAAAVSGLSVCNMHSSNSRQCKTRHMMEKCRSYGIMAHQLSKLWISSHTISAMLSASL